MFERFGDAPRPFKRVVIMANDVDRLGGVGRFMNNMGVEFFRRGYAVELVGIAEPPAGHYQPMKRPDGIIARTLMSGAVPEDWTLNTAAHRRDPARRARYKKRMEMRAEAVDKLKHLLTEWGNETVVICTQVYGMEHMLEAGYDASDRSLPTVIGQYHGSFDMAARTNSDLKRVLKAYSDIARTVFLADADAESFCRAGLNNTDWIANPVEAPPALDNLTRRNVIVALGRYEEQKSLDYLIRAWALIAHDLPEWSVELYGEGSLRQALSELIDELNVPRITLEGKTDEVGNVLASSKIHALSSQDEGLPIAIVEAARLGVPSVAFDCAPGISDLIHDNETGFVVPLNDTGALADRLAELARNEQLLESMSAAAVIDARRFDSDVIIAKWEQLFAELSW